MKIKAILIVFIFIILSSFLFSVLSSKTNTQNNKIFYVEEFIKAIKDRLVAPATVVKQQLKITATPTRTAPGPEVLAEVERLREELGASRIEELTIIPYMELPKGEQKITMDPALADDVFIVKYKGKKVMSVLVAANKIAAFQTVTKGNKEVFNTF
jgi:hypothetical protein